MFKLVKTACAFTMALLLNVLPADAQARDVPVDNSFKSYMSYRAITNTASDQYAFQQQCVTDHNGLRVYNGRYCIAVGTYYTNEVGVNIDVVMQNGTVIPCVTGDIKSDTHTDVTNRQIPVNGNVVEFIVDTAVLPNSVRVSGDVSAIPGFDGEIAYLDVHSDSIVLTTYMTEDLVFTTFVTE